MTSITGALTAVRNELEARGLVRRPGDAGPLPPMHVEPQGGPPAPGEREPPETTGILVATLRLSGEGPARAGEAFRRLIVVDLVYRSKGGSAGLVAGRALDGQIRAALVEGTTYGSGLLLDEGGPSPTFVLEASVFAGLGPVSEIGGIRTESSKLALEVLAS